MAYEQRDNSGSLFRNNKREKDTQPNARGSAKIDGVDYWVDAWTKKDKNGNPWQSLAFKKKEQRPEEAQPAATPAPKPEPKGHPAFDDMNSDIPF